MKRIPFTQLNEEDTNLLNQSIEALDLSYSPYSNFKVGVSVLMHNGSIVKGANQENAAYPMCLCGEQIALAHAAMSFPKEKISTLCIATSNPSASDVPPSPCGACRQIINEFEHRQKESIKIYLVGTDAIYVFDTIQDLLPHSFSGDAL